MMNQPMNHDELIAGAEAGMSEPREGWYIAYMPNGCLECIKRDANGVWFQPHYFGETLPPGWTLGPRLDDLMRDATEPHGHGWEPIKTAPEDRLPVWVFTASLGPPEIDGWLPSFEGPCAWHPDAGFCTDELRMVTHWHPETTKTLRGRGETGEIRSSQRLSYARALP